MVAPHTYTLMVETKTASVQSTVYTLVSSSNYFMNIFKNNDCDLKFSMFCPLGNTDSKMHHYSVPLYCLSSILYLCLYCSISPSIESSLHILYIHSILNIQYTFL